MWYKSELLNGLGVKHGFFTNHGGVSVDEFVSLNVKDGIGDSRKNISNNRKLIADALGVKEMIFTNHLPHENVCKWYDEATNDDPAVDALATSSKGLAIGLSVADCLPIIISDGRIVSVIHAGWRGTVAHIAEKTITMLVEKHAFDLDNAIAACGPCICPEHFEVGGKVAQQLSDLAGEVLKNEKYKADILALNVKQLKNAGVKNIDTLGICSYESDDFYSFRQSDGKTGRNMAIALLS